MGLTLRDDHTEVAAQLRTLLNAIDTPEEAYKPYIFFCEHTKEAVKDALQNNATSGCDIIVSIGYKMTTLLIELQPEIGLIPTLFVGIPKSVELGLVQSLQKPGGVLSGVCMEEPSVQQLADNLKVLYPYVTKISIPYSLADNSEVIKTRVLQLVPALERIGFEVITYEAHNPQHGLDWVTNSLETIQAILLVEGCLLSSYAEPYIAYLCTNTERILISSNGYAGIENGAPFSYGVKESPLLPEVVAMIRRFWRDRKAVGLQPVSVLPESRFLIVNKFMLPWLPSSLLQKIYSHPGLRIIFKWINCPITIGKDDT